MELTNMTFEERLAMMLKRQAFLSLFTEGCSTFEDFIKANDEKLAIMGIELYQDSHTDHHICLRFDFGYNEYETYHVVYGQDGRLEISNIIWWQDDMCCNELMDISGPERFIESDEW